MKLMSIIYKSTLVFENKRQLAEGVPNSSSIT